ncbi:MAG: hypothetical protein H8D92_01515 [Pelagibacteraceae bacterium]|jgi:hypothetical protein|nr:hypothetical protein [Pelagibacteraceae bacterium]
MMTTEEMLKKEAVRLKMAKLRSKRKPPKLANVHHTVKSLPDDNTLSYVSVKKWISTQESIVKTARITERSIKSEVSQKDKDQAMRTRIGAQSYIRAIKQYITTGDWTSMYYGEFENKLMQWTTIAAVGK